MLGQKNRPAMMEAANALIEALRADSAPVYLYEGQTIRVCATRVNASLVWHRYLQGRSPEQIVHSFDTLRLEDVYTLIGAYLRHRALADAYLERGALLEAEIRQQIEAMNPNDPLRERVLARRAEQAQGKALAP